MIAAHFSDLHYCEKHLEWVDKAFGYAVSDAIKRKADVAILSGDSFDSSIHLHEPAVAAFLSRVAELAEHMPVAVLAGTASHDRPGCLDVLHTIKGLYPVVVLDRICQAVIDDGWIVSDQWAFQSLHAAGILISALPSINKGAVAAAAGCENAATAAGEMIHDLCCGWSLINLQAREAGIPTVLVTHGTVNGCVTECAHAMVSNDHEFTARSLFDAETSAVAVGHIHAHQSWEQDGRRIAYPGSITKLIYGHKGKVGYLLWDVQPDRADFEHIETPSREMIEIESNGPPDMAKLAELAADAAGTYVRIRYQVDTEHRHSVDQEAIRALLKDAAQVKIEARINPVIRTRADGIGKVTSLAEKVARWAELTETEAQPLVDRLALLDGADPDVIAGAIICGDAKREEAA